LWGKDRAKWESIVEGTGVLNILTMFNDIMLQGGDLDYSDGPFAFMGVGGNVIPSKNMKSFMNLLRLGRDKFMTSSDSRVDNMLMKMEAKSRGIDTSDIVRLRKLNAERKSILTIKRGELYDVLAAPAEDNEEAIMLKRMKKLTGDIADKKLRKMVSWKLSWHFDPFKGVFTFSGTETNLRKLTALMAMLDAEKRGRLGGNIEVNGSGGDGSIFRTETARRIARDAVYNTQFGMTPEFMGEGFNGFWRWIMQYKTYPAQQMGHDMDVLRKWWMRGEDRSGSLSRLFKEHIDGFQRWQKGKGYDPTDTSIDHEAVQVMRMLYTRGIASVLATFMSVIPILGFALRRFGGGNGFSLLRSFENPALGITMRLLAWTVMLGMGDDDDDGASEFFEDFSLLFLPVFIGMMARDVKGVNDWHSEYFD